MLGWLKLTRLLCLIRSLHPSSVVIRPEFCYRLHLVAAPSFFFPALACVSSFLASIQHPCCLSFFSSCIWSLLFYLTPSYLSFCPLPEWGLRNFPNSTARWRQQGRFLSWLQGGVGGLVCCCYNPCLSGIVVLWPLYYQRSWSGGYAVALNRSSL